MKHNSILSQYQYFEKITKIGNISDVLKKTAIRLRNYHSRKT